MTQQTASGSGPARDIARSSQALAATRALFHLASVISVTAWGLLAWRMPFPGILVAAGALVLSVALWALFLSPRPVLHTDRFGQALIELLLIAAAVASLFAIGAPWYVAVPFGLAGAALGYAANAPAKK